MARRAPHAFQCRSGAPASLAEGLDLWDPFGFTKKMSDEKKAKSLVAECNIGRLAINAFYRLMSGV